MLKRKIINELLEWKKQKNKECLLIKGARQIGKTYAVRYFGNTYYENFVELNFYNNHEYNEFFDGNLNVDEIKKKIQFAIPSARFEDKKTLLFFDEIEFCPNARTALKFFAEDNRYDVIATGSHMSLKYKEVISYPVGYEKQIEMFPLDFEEFLWANGYDEDKIKEIEKYFIEVKKVDEAINSKMDKLLHEYMIVGGMPEVVNEYIETNDIVKTNALQEKIVNDYLDDITKYAKNTEKTKVRNCYLSIPKQLDKDNKKWTYTLIESNASGRKYENSLLWMEDSRIGKKCHAISRIEYPLGFFKEDNKFKVYMGDIGLLVYMYGYSMKKKIVDKTLTGYVKGGIYENLIADIFIKNRVPIYYYKKENSTQEIEFVATIDGEVVPIEVKSTNGHTASMNEILKYDNIKYGYKFVDGNVGVIDKKITLPLYMAMYVAKKAEKSVVNI